MGLGKIDHIDVSVGNLEMAEKYFTQKLGFRLMRRTEHGGKSVELQSPAGDFFFDIHEGGEGLYRTEINHIAFSIDDINKEYEDLKSKGVPLRSDAPVFNPTTGRTLVNVIDFDGHFWIQLTDVP
ncbi:unnamed protein product, partial [marine sediment metagenome]